MADPNHFLEKTKHALAARAGHVCSAPGCERLTSGPSGDADDATVNAGEACHIRGAQPGSPRYDESMTPDERRSIGNGIWLCSFHHTLIDRDVTTYTVEVLHQWKDEALARAKKRLFGGAPTALAASRLYGAPRLPSNHFLGRDEEMDRLQELLQHSTAVRIAASVEGLPGIGKTELALQFVNRLALDGAFPGGIFWFNAEDPGLESTWGSSIANALGIPPGPLDERAIAACRRVSSSPQPALLVLDNVDRWSHARRPRPLPEGTHLRYLVTTRKRNLGGTSFAHVKVGFLDEAASRDLLLALSGRELSTASAFDDLVEHLGGHALAVELAGAFLGTYRSETPQSYLAQLRAGDDVEGEASELVRYERTVQQAFQTLWDRLDEEVRAAWRLAACFEPEPVTAELSEALGLTGQSFRQLERLHLIEVDGEGRWWMHRLTREFGQQILPTVLAEKRGWIQRLSRRLRRQAGPDEELAAARRKFVEGCAEFADRIELADGFRPYLPNRAHLDAAVALAPEVLAPNDPRISSFQDRIATALQAAGELRRAKKLFELALASDLENLGEDHLAVAARRANLGWLLQNLGLLEEARGMLEKAVTSALSNLGEDHPSVAISRSNLAVVLKDLGDLEEAKGLLDLALASDLKNLGEDHPAVATRRSNLAAVLKDLGDLDRAKQLLQLALASDLENLGEDHPSVAIDRSSLAIVLRDLGELEAARGMAEEALRVAALQPEGSYVRTRTEATVRGILETKAS